MNCHLGTSIIVCTNVSSKHKGSTVLLFEVGCNGSIALTLLSKKLCPKLLLLNKSSRCNVNFYFRLEVICTLKQICMLTKELEVFFSLC